MDKMTPQELEDLFEQALEAEDGIVAPETLAAEVWAGVHASEGAASVSLTANFTKRIPAYTYQVYYNVAGTRTEIKAQYTSTVGVSLGLHAPETYTDDSGTYYFSGWISEGVHYSSTAITVWPNDEGTYEAVAYYTAEEEIGVPTVSFTRLFPEVVNGAHVIGSTMAYSLPKGYTLVETGFKYSSTKAKANVENAYKSVFQTSQPSGAYTLHYRPSKDNSAYYVAAYLTYKDKDGVETTIYADVNGAEYPFNYRYGDTDFLRVCWSVLE